MNTTPSTAKDDVNALANALAVKGLGYSIGWFWNGRCRHGALTLENAMGQRVFRANYVRNTQRWCSSDEDICKTRTGSTKHDAIKLALAFLQS